MNQLSVSANHFGLIETYYVKCLTCKWNSIQGCSHVVQLPKIPAHTIARVDAWVDLDQEGGHMVYGWWPGH
jgi:hypothetical protein